MQIKIKIRIFIKPGLLFVIILHSIFIIGQDTARSLQTDTLKIKAGNVIIINDSVIKVINDTLIIVNDTTKVLTEKDSKHFYSRLKSFAQKHRVTKELYNATFVSFGDTVIKADKPFKSTDPYLTSSGKIIRKVQIMKLNVFGPSLIDSVNYDTCLTKVKSKFHINTSDRVIYNNLLFSEGDTVNPVIIAENAKLLRELPYIQNATIQIYNISKDSVDVLIVTKDVFKWVVIPIINTAKKWRLKIRNVNVLGLGHEFSNTFSYDADDHPQLQWSYLSYSINNIRRSFINSMFSYDKTDEGIDYRLDFTRSFIPYKVNWGGEIALLRGERNITYSVNDSTQAPWSLKFNQKDIWVGRQFLLQRLKTKDDYPVWFVPAIRFVNLQYTNRPETPDSSFSMKNKSDILSSIAFSKQQYYRVSYLNEFGKTEDFPYGFLLKLTGGYSFAEFRDRTYTAIKAAYGGVLKRNSLYFLSAEYGTYFLNEKPHQEVFHAILNYAAPLIHFRKNHIRNILVIDYITGINMQPVQEIYLNNDHGIKGLKTNELKGQQRLYLHLESNLFTPINYYGFKMLFFVAADIGFIGDNRGIFSNAMYGGYSLGIRIKNDYLVFGTFQFSFTFFPNAPTDTKGYIVDFSEMSDLRFHNFNIGAPSYVGFD